MSSNPTPNPNADLLLQAGINAARAGDKPTAREKLRQLVEIDPQSEKGWYWLAAVAETVEEKRICLGNVIVINPNNEKAKQLLEQLSFSTTGYISGSSVNLATSDTLTDQRRVIFIVAGAVVVLLILMIVLFGNRAGNTPIAAVTEPPTAVPGAATAASTSDIELSVTVVDETATSIVETQVAQALPTLPPTWTPEIEATPRGTLTATPLPDAPDLPGRIVVQYGKPLTLDGFLPLGEYNPNTREFTQFQPISNRRGDYGRLVPVNQELVYGRYVSGGRPQLIMFSVNLISGREIEIGSLYNRQPPVANQKMVSISPSGTGIVFVGNNVAGENDATSDVYYLPYTFINANATATPTPSETPTVTPTLTPTATFTPDPDPTIPTVTPPPTWTPEPTFTPTSTPEPLALRRVTAKDSGVNTDPVFSPDGMQIAYVSDRTSIGQLVTDLFIVPVNETFTPERNLTNDGKELIEAAPDWSPDGSLIVFQAAFEGSEVNRLYLINADGTERRVLVENFGNCTRPHFSPDGRWVVFTSDRTQKTELYVVEVSSGEIFQISAVADTIVATDWGN